MKDMWFKIPKCIRQMMGLLIIWGFMIVTLSASIKLVDVFSLATTSQLDGQSQWAVQESGIKIVEVQE